MVQVRGARARTAGAVAAGAVSPEIRFGTDGWRAVIAREFTFDNVARVARAIAAYVLGAPAPRGVVVGYDNRFLSEEFARLATEVLNAAGVPVLLTGGPAPTPAVAWAVREHGLAGAVMLTASHNPPIYHGIKFISPEGGPSGPEITTRIEAHLREGRRISASGGGAAAVQTFDPAPGYRAQLRRLVNLEAVGRAHLRLVVDPMHGSGAGYLEDLLREAGCEVTSIRTRRDPYFGGGLPEPVAARLEPLFREVSERDAALGLALDGDADRFGIVDRGGRFVSPNQFLPVLLNHLLRVRRLQGPVGRTVATTHLLDRVAEASGSRAVETPVGFKYQARLLVDEGAVLGSEESGGVSIAGHIPEKDGILAGLLAAEIVATSGLTFDQLTRSLHARFGPHFSARRDIPFPAEARSRTLESLPELRPDRLPAAVTGRNTVDGVKLTLADGSWFLARPSGTENLLRVYAEAADPNRVARLQDAVVSALGL